MQTQFTRENLSGKDVLIVGMARSGVAAAQMLLELGAKVTLNDQRDRPAFAGALDEFDGRATFALGQEVGELYRGRDLILFSSGVPFWSEWIAQAREAGIPCYNELELGFQLSRAPFVAVTGTNGKTTTTTLLTEIFRNAGKQSYAVGNIGVPVCTHALEMQPDGILVEEAAPFQMISAPSFHPRVSMILNITEDHLNWFHTMDNYIDKKCLVFAKQAGDDVCILNADDPIASSLGDRPRCKVMWFTHQKQLLEGAFVREGELIVSVAGEEHAICRTEEVRIPGLHNLENALAASLAAFLMGVPADVIAHTLKTFAGVEHRIETVRTLHGVTYINDSKATNPEAAIKAIEAMKQPTVLILGGSEKYSDFHPMFRAFTPYIREIVVLGVTADAIARTAQEEGFTHVHRAYSFEEAVHMARALAHEGMNVLLSPACASYDMFQSYEHRGREFKRLVWEMK